MSQDQSGIPPLPQGIVCIPALPKILKVPAPAINSSEPAAGAVVYSTEEKAQRLEQWLQAKEAREKGVKLTSADLVKAHDLLPAEAKERVKVADMADILNAIDTAVGMKNVKELTETEMRLRKEVVAMHFPAPKEGTNNLGLPDGKLKYTHKIDRKVDAAVLKNISARLLEGYQLDVETVVAYTPELKTKEYKELLNTNAAARALLDTAVTSKAGSPVLEFESSENK